VTDHNRYYADGCPRCLNHGNRPSNGIADDQSLTAAYHCTNCRHVWTCTWAIVPGRVLPPAPAMEGAA